MKPSHEQRAAISARRIRDESLTMTERIDAALTLRSVLDTHPHALTGALSLVLVDTARALIPGSAEDRALARAILSCLVLYLRRDS